VALYGKGVFDQDTFYPDADRIAMDGIYFHDLIKDMPFTRIFEYTIRYFAQYPALSVGYRLPFFQIIEGIFFLVLGISMSTAKIAVLAFAAVGILFFYKLIRLIYDDRIAALASLLFITTPFIFRWARVPMQEIPTLAMAIVAIYYFYQYVESGGRRSLIFALVTLILALYTKHNAFFLIPMFAMYVLLRKKYTLLIKKEALFACAILVLAMVPFVIITLKFGSFNIEQSVGSGKMAVGGFDVFGIKSASRIGLPNLLYHVRTLYKAHITLPVLLLSIIGLMFAAIKRDKRVILFLVWILAVYIMVTYSRGKNIRYPIYWIPAFCVLAASVAGSLRQKHAKNTGSAMFSVLIVIISLFQIDMIHRKEPLFEAIGYREAAEYVTSNPKGYTVFFEGYANGSFIFWVRKFDDRRKFIVLRGDKLLMSSVIGYKNKLKVYVNSPDEIYDIFKRYGTTYVVVEEKNISGIEVLDTLRELLRTDKFRLVKKIPVKATGLPSLQGQSVLIYERLEKAELPKGKLVLPVPTVGTTIEVNAEDLR